MPTVVRMAMECHAGVQDTINDFQQIAERDGAETVTLHNEPVIGAFTELRPEIADAYLSGELTP